MPELLVTLGGLGTVFLLVAAVMLVLLPFFVFRIRNEIIEMNRRQMRILSLMESVIPASKKPPSEPTKTCRNCKTINKLSAIRCVHCGNKFGLESD